MCIAIATYVVVPFMQLKVYYIPTMETSCEVAQRAYKELIKMAYIALI